MSRRVLTTSLVIAFLAAFATAEAATNLNSSKSNCVKAGGTWVTGRDGKGSCDLGKQAKGKKDGPAGLAVSDPGAEGSKPTKSTKK
jgi:hypothetical protein